MRIRNTPYNRGMAKVWTIILTMALGLAAVCIGAFIGWYLGDSSLPNPITSITQVFSPPFDGKRSVKILVIGEDNNAAHLKDEQRGLSDTIILVSVDFNKNNAAALSIPRDIRVKLPGTGDDGKINAAYNQGGAYHTEMAVYELTGIKPDYYIKTNVDGFKKIVDEVGGVEIDVEKNMRYTDNWGGLHINLKKGLQVLDGEKAMQYVRFRHDAMGDISRIQRQQKFIKALLKKAFTIKNIPKFPHMVSAFMNSVETDLLTGDLIALSEFTSKIDMERVKMGTYPGTPETIDGISYLIPDPIKGYEVVQEVFFNNIDPTLPTIQVLNGCGGEGNAKIAADAIKREGYEVLSIGNADTFDFDSSQVITHKENLKGIDRLTYIVGPSISKHEEEKEAEADVTVIIGKDCSLISMIGESTY